VPARRSSSSCGSTIKSRIGDQTILAQISAKPGQPLDRAQLDADIGTVYGLDVFESVRYEVVQEDGKTGLLLHTKEKSWGPDYLQFGMELSDNFEGDSSYNLGVLYTKTAINPLNGELRLGVQIGQDPGLTAEWHQPLDPASRYFVSTKTYLRRDQFSRYDGDDIVSDFNIWRVGLDLAIGREFGTWGEGRVGYRRFKGEADVRIGDPALDDYSFDGGQLYGRLFLDKLDNVYFPTKGNKGILELTTSSKSLGSDSSYDQARLSYSHAFSRGRNNFVGALSFNTTLDDDAPPEALFRTGGFLQSFGYRPNQLSGQHSGLVVLVFYRRITDTKILPAYIGGSIEYGNVWQDSDDIAFDDGLLNGSLFLGADTPVGQPTSAWAWGKAETTRCSSTWARLSREPDFRQTPAVIPAQANPGACRETFRHRPSPA
jgi:NTE family protein